MKKFFSIAILSAVLLATSNSTALAANNVSRMALTKGGQQVAACAQMMEKGVSQCARSNDCNMN